MVEYIAVVSWGSDNRVKRYARYDSEAEAEAHVATHGGFYALNPGGDWNEWLVDNDGDNISYSPPPAATAPVAIVTPRQARLALLGAGVLSSIETYLSAPGNEAAKITWEYALEIRRDDPLIAAVGGALELTEQQIDNLFTTAKNL